MDAKIITQHQPLRSVVKNIIKNPSSFNTISARGRSLKVRENGLPARGEIRYWMKSAVMMLTTNNNANTRAERKRRRSAPRRVWKPTSLPPPPNASPKPVPVCWSSMVAMRRAESPICTKGKIVAIGCMYRTLYHQRRMTQRLTFLIYVSYIRDVTLLQEHNGLRLSSA